MMENDKANAAKNALADLERLYGEIDTADLGKPFDANQKRTEPYVVDIKHLSVEGLLAAKGE